MKPNPTRSALLVIDMENGFVHPEGGHWIRFAQSMVPNCVRAVELARVRFAITDTWSSGYSERCHDRIFAAGDDSRR